MREEKHTFSTRDWLMMAALAALGGVTGTYVNAIGDLMQSILGFAGTTQWAAGLHVVWLTLAMGLTGRVGAGTVTGLLKGLVELDRQHARLVGRSYRPHRRLARRCRVPPFPPKGSSPGLYAGWWTGSGLSMCLRSSSLQQCCPPICWRTVRWRWWDSWPSRRVWSSLVC